MNYKCITSILNGSTNDLIYFFIGKKVLPQTYIIACNNVKTVTNVDSFCFNIDSYHIYIYLSEKEAVFCMVVESFGSFIHCM